MSRKPNDEVGFVVRVGRPSGSPKPLPEIPFRIALLGDFSGRTSRGLIETGPDLADRTAVRVDAQNLDEVLARFAPELQVRLGDESGPCISVRFEEFEDFHPDRLYQRLAVFRSLREMRQRLADPRAFAQVEGELRNAIPPAPEETPAALPESVPENLLEQVLAETEDVAAQPRAPVDNDLRTFLKRVVAPHVVPGIDARQEELLAQVDESIAEVMRSLLHQPAFQSLEALWRGVFFLTRRTETGSELQLHLIDISKAELAADLASDGELEDSGLYRLLVEASVGTPGGQPWALLTGGYYFGPEAEDLERLQRLAAIAKLAGAPWVSAADPRLAGCESFHTTPDPRDWADGPNPAWEALRRTAEAPWLGLVLPRFLLRLPYGADTEPCELLRFEEVGDTPAHEHLLWANPAFACALLLAESYAEAGWNLVPGMNLEIRQLPLYLTKVGSDVRAQPCAEVLLTERAAARVLERGLMPLATIKDSDSVRLVRFQSVAYPPSPLEGWWAVADTV